MVPGLLILLACQLVGEVAARGLSLPVPGPVLGLLLLVVGLLAWNRWRPFDDAALQESSVGRVAAALLANLALLFVPAGVGVTQHLGLVGEHGVALGIALVVSTFVTLLVTVGVFRAVKRMTGGDAGPGEGSA
ncbi:CidA/LrgA family protein [Alsobacter sp. R-9]